MSKVISIRIPNSLYDQLKNTGRPIKDVTIEALQRYFYYHNLTVTRVNKSNIHLSHEDIEKNIDLLLKRREGGL